MKLIQLDELRGKWQSVDENGALIGGDDTIESIKMVAEKVNELIEKLQSDVHPNL